MSIRTYGFKSRLQYRWEKAESRDSAFLCSKTTEFTRDGIWTQKSERALGLGFFFHHVVAGLANAGEQFPCASEENSKLPSVLVRIFEHKKGWGFWVAILLRSFCNRFSQLVKEVHSKWNASMENEVSYSFSKKRLLQLQLVAPKIFNFFVQLTF